MDNKLTLRMSKIDTDRIIVIATAMRTTASPFITRSAAAKFALKVVAADPQRFIAEALKA